MAALLAGYILITSIKNHVATPYDLTNYYMISISGKRELKPLICITPASRRARRNPTARTSKSWAKI